MTSQQISSYRAGPTATTIAVAAIGATAIGAAILAYLLNRRTRAGTLASVSDYREAGRVEQLFVHPLKSCKAVPVS